MAKMWLVVAVAIVMLTNGISAKKYTVGGEEGWVIPESPGFYSSWAANHTFEVGDVLVFKLDGVHTVANVTKEDYKNCETGEAKAQDETTDIILDRTGSFYFICTVGNHCEQNQKLAVEVGSTKSADTPTTTPATTPTDSGTGRFSQTLTSTFFSVTFTAFILTFLYY